MTGTAERSGVRGDEIRIEARRQQLPAKFRPGHPPPDRSNGSQRERGQPFRLIAARAAVATCSAVRP